MRERFGSSRVNRAESFDRVNPLIIAFLGAVKGLPIRCGRV